MTDRLLSTAVRVPAPRPPADAVRWGSHAALACTNLREPAALPARSDRIDAVIVPASRGASAVEGAAHLSASLGATLVALCSRDTWADTVLERVARGAGCRILAVDVPPGYHHDLLPTRTAAPRFRAASPGRTTDLSVKRNVGLLLARLLSWGKVLFLDDDIGSPTSGSPVGLPAGTVRRLVAALDSRQIAGLTCRTFADNSVVCHGRRLAGFEQDTFVSGAAAGVNCNDRPVPFFPDVYNEDWFFFSRRVAARDLAHVGDAVQAPYDPFASPERARQEEFGDLLAEGLFTLFEDQPDEMGYRYRLDAADAGYWQRFTAERRAEIARTSRRLEIVSETSGADADRLAAARRSLGTADDQLSRLAPELCVDYLAAWADDLVEWERETQRIRAVGGTAEALDVLGLTGWAVAERRAPLTASCT